MRMLFRVDANKNIGRGHLSRMIALAQMLYNDYEIVFVIDQENEGYCKDLLKSWTAWFFRSDSDFQKAITRKDVLWVDGYNFDNAWRLRFQPLVFKLIYISDFPGDIRGADVVVNHSPGVRGELYLKASNTDYLLGLKYAMLRPNFLEIARTDNPNKSQGTGVFVCFGGADPKNLGYHFVKGLLQSGFTDSIYFVSNAAAKQEDLQQRSNVHLLENLSEMEMIHYMQKSAVVVVPSSVLSFETMALRKPLFTMYYVDNQQLIYNGIIALGMGIGGGLICAESDILNTIDSFLAFYKNKDQQDQVIKIQQSFLDGQSAMRIKSIVDRWNIAQKEAISVH